MLVTCDGAMRRRRTSEELLTQPQQLLQLTFTFTVIESEDELIPGVVAHLGKQTSL